MRVEMDFPRHFSFNADMRIFYSISAIAIASLAALTPRQAGAEFIVSSAIVEFTAGGPQQQDVEIISRSKDNDYVVAEVNEILNPGTKNETKRLIDDPAQSWLLVTPDKSVLAGEGRKILRFVLLIAPDEAEHIYRVAVKPVIRGVESDAKMGLKILVGYEVLTIIRPAHPKPAYTARRLGRTLRVQNTGNTNILFQGGQQCAAQNDCRLAPVMRVYAGQEDSIELALDAPVTYSVWNGTERAETRFE